MSAALQPTAEGRPSKSFRDAVSRPVIPIQEHTTVKGGGTFRGEPALFYSDEEVSQLASPFAMVLVGKFTSARPNMEFLRKGFQLIGFKGDVSLGLLDSHHILIRFALHEDYYRCWMRGSWSFKTHIMKVLKWTPDFTADHEPPVVPLWVSFTHLPIHLFQHGPLMSLATLIGRPIKIDAATRSLSRPSVARVCVEVNLLSSLPKRIWIGQGDSGFWQTVTYDNLPQYCSTCATLGHADNDCSSQSTSLPRRVWKPKPTAAEHAIPESVPTHPNTSGLSSHEKATVPVDVPAAVLTSAILPNPLDLPQSPRVPDPASTALLPRSPKAPLVRSPPIANSGEPPPGSLMPQLPPLSFNPAYISDDEELDEEIEVLSAPASPIHRSGSISRQISSDPLPHDDVSDTEAGPWITQRKRKPYQKRIFGQTHMVTRSKSVPASVSND